MILMQLMILLERPRERDQSQDRAPGEVECPIAQGMQRLLSSVSRKPYFSRYGTEDNIEPSTTVCDTKEFINGFLKRNL